MVSQLEFQKLLRTHLTEGQIRNSAYSIRAFAKRLEIGVGTLSQVLSGKRNLSAKSISKVLVRLNVSPAIKAKILTHDEKKLSFQYSELNADQYFILSEWYYLGILNLIRTKNFISSPQHISERLGISLTLARQAVGRLERAGLLKITNGKMMRTRAALATSDGIQNSALRKSHYQSLELARNALDCHAFESFDTTWLTFAFDPKRMPEAKASIRKYQDEFAEQFSTSPDATQVYRFSTQLFNLTIDSIDPNVKARKS